MTIYDMKVICFCLWLLGSLTVFYMGAFGRIEAGSFNNVPWSQVLKSKQHQIFLATAMAFAMMWIIAGMEHC